MPEVEFEVKQDALLVIRNTVIEANFEEVKAALTEMIAPYQSMIVTEDGIAAAKTDRARIRKVANGIEDMRKTVGREYKKPLSDFEAKCKELVAICDDGAGNLDGQIKAYEEREKQEKFAKLRADYDDHANEEIQTYCPWERIFNEKWGNKGYDLEKCREEIGEAIAGTVNDLETIRSTGGQDVPYLLDVYKQTRDLGAVMRKASELKARREAEEKRKAELDAALRAAKENKAPRVFDAADPDAFAKAKPGDVISFDGAAKSAEDEIVTVDFRVECSKRQLASLKGFLRANGIKYGRVP